MIRLLISLAVRLLAAAIGLLVAALALSGMSLDAAAFVLAVIIFTAVEAIAEPLLRKLALKKARALRGGVDLVATFVALLITDVASSGLSISGVSTWLLATVIVWVVTLLAGLVLPALFVKRRAEDRRGPKG